MNKTKITLSFTNTIDHPYFAFLQEEGCSDLDQYAAVPGTKEFLPDFFLDDFDKYTKATESIKTVQSPGDAGAQSGGSVQSVFDRIEGLVNEELVNKTKAVYQFTVKGQLFN